MEIGIVEDFKHFKHQEEMIQIEIAKSKMQKNIWKQREYTVPKKIENFLRKHTTGFKSD